MDEVITKRGTWTVVVGVDDAARPYVFTVGLLETRNHPEWLRTSGKRAAWIAAPLLDKMNNPIRCVSARQNDTRVFVDTKIQAVDADGCGGAATM